MARLARRSPRGTTAMQQHVISATIEALQAVRQARFFRTERAYHGRFYCALQAALDARGILNDEVVAEMEYQKSARHRLHQRPDIIIHIPAELHGAPVYAGNFAVYALKRRASQRQAQADFDKLQEMFEQLRYPLGFFINVDSKHHHLNAYTGTHRDRIHAFAVQLLEGEVSVIHASWIEEEVRAVQI